MREVFLYKFTFYDHSSVTYPYFYQKSLTEKKKTFASAVDVDAAST